MSRFCTQCGTVNEADARFCDACGKPLKPRTPAPAAAPSASAAIELDTPPTPALPSRRLPWPWLGGGVALLLLLAAAWYWLQPQEPSKGVFMVAINQHLAQHDADYRRKVCLRNLPYGKQSLVTSSFDQASNAWLGELVKAGLYAAPQKISNGFFGEQLEYQQTDLARAAVVDGRLCVGSGIEAVTVTQWSPPQAMGELLVSQVRYDFQPRQPVAWLTPAIRRELFGEAGKGEARIMLLRKDGRWQVADDGERQALEAAVFMQALAKEGIERAGEQASTGLKAWLGRLFGPAEPSADDIWQALLDYSPVLASQQQGYAKQDCSALAQQPDTFSCRIRVGGSRERVLLSKNGDGVWQLRLP